MGLLDYPPPGDLPLPASLGLSYAPSRLVSRALWLTTARHSEREPQKWSFLQPPARLWEGSRCSESSIFTFSKELTLRSILNHYWTPKEGLSALRCLPRGACGSIWALIGAWTSRLTHPAPADNPHSPTRLWLQAAQKSFLGASSQASKASETLIFRVGGMSRKPLKFRM